MDEVNFNDVVSSPKYYVQHVLNMKTINEILYIFLYKSLKCISTHSPTQCRLAASRGLVGLNVAGA